MSEEVREVVYKVYSIVSIYSIKNQQGRSNIYATSIIGKMKVQTEII